MKTWIWIAVCLLAFVIFSWAGMLVVDAVPSHMRGRIFKAGDWLVVTALAGYWARHAGKLPANSSKAWPLALWTLAGVGVVAHLWFYVDDGCYVDWDGRSNSTVCE